MVERPHTIETSEIDPPPEAPEIERRFQLLLSQGIGVAFLTAIVLLAAVGLLGEGRGTASGRTASLALSIEHPTRFRHSQIQPLRVLVTNLSTRLIDTLSVSFDTAYLARFSDADFTPSASRAWEVALTAVRPGETRRIEVRLKGERYGRHAGMVSGFFSGSDTVRAEVSTFILP